MYSEQLAELKKRIQAGETGLLDEYERLLVGGAPEPQSDDDTDESEVDPVVERMLVKRRGRPPGTGGNYTLTDKALAQRKDASKHSTGPVTPEGKAACSKNAWKHGMHARNRVLSLGKPCVRTCPHYPCDLVHEGATAPGKDCLDKQYMLQCIEAINRAMKNGDLDGVKDIAAIQIGSSLQVLDQLQQAILETGVHLKSEKLDKEGRIIGHELKLNPAFLPLAKLLQATGMNLQEFMTTPAALERKKSSDQAVETLADIFRGTAAQLTAAKQKKNGEQ
jgi:hypothetical protein